MACRKAAREFEAVEREMFDAVRARSLGNKDLSRCRTVERLPQVASKDESWQRHGWC